MNDRPQFALTCIKTDSPTHLFTGVIYKVDPWEKDKQGEVPVYWYHPMEYKWVLIGNYPIDFFNTEPIKKWIAEKKGVAYVPPQKIQRQRPMPVQRSRPVAQPVRQRPAPVQRQRPGR